MQTKNNPRPAIIVVVLLAAFVSTGFAADPPALEFRLVATPAASDRAPRIPGKIEEMVYRRASEERHPEQDRGFAWFPADAQILKSGDPKTLISRQGEDGGNEILLADDAKYGLLSDGSWRIIECVLLERENSSGSVLKFRLDDVGAEKMRDLTKNNLKSRLAIVVNGQVVTAPMILAEIGGHGLIESGHSIDEARVLYRDLLTPPRD